MESLGKILCGLGIIYHFYADDRQIFITFNVNESDGDVTKVEDAVRIIKNWMSSNFLYLNEEKTEVLLIASKCNHGKLNTTHVNIYDNKISPAGTRYPNSQAATSTKCSCKDNPATT